MKLRYEIAVWGVVLGLCLGLLVHAALHDGITNDEVLYLTTGQLQIQRGDFRLNPTHPPLASTLIGLGLMGGGFQTPKLGASGDPMAVCSRFVHEDNDAGRVVLRGRLPVVVLALSLVALVGLWARKACGPWGGLLALALAAFHPSLLAHGHLATTDVPAVFFMLATLLAFDRWLARPTLGLAVAFGLLFGLALATRVTAVLLVPTLALGLMASSLPRRGPRPQVRRAATLLLMTALLVPLVLWSTYRFRDTPWPEGLWKKPQAQGFSARVVDLVGTTSLLPVAYLDGVRFQIEHSRKGHPGYLLGERSKTGFLGFAAVALATKNTPGFLLALALAVGLGLAKGWFPRRPRALVLAGLALTIFVATSVSRVQIGERYLLAAYPPLIILVAWTLTRLGRSRWVIAAVALALALHVVPVLRQAPDGFIAYFNVFAGGEAGGHRFLLDSSLDWGQDLPRLAAWMRRERIPRIALAYHGVDDPSRFGIARDDLPGITLYREKPSRDTRPAVVVVSPNLLFGLVGRAGDAYADLRRRPPDSRAGVFFIYRPLDSPHPEAR